MTTWVLLRGLARESRHWGDFASRLQSQLPLPDVVVALDLPGNGLRWQERSPDTIAGMVEAARRELALLPHRPPYVLVALSLGGMVALHWAAQERRKVAGCVLINSSQAGLSLPWQRLRPSALAHLLALARPGLSAAQRERGVLRLTSHRPHDATTEAAWARLARECPVSRVNLLRQLRAALLSRPPQGGAAVPTLLLTSAQDRIVSPACSRALARAWNQPLVEHPQAGHDLPLDAPDWVIEQIVAWWDLRHR